jgi:hypothetical protein
MNWSAGLRPGAFRAVGTLGAETVLGVPIAAFTVASRDFETGAPHIPFKLPRH